MPKRRFTDAQIAMVVREIENGASVAEVSRKLGLGGHPKPAMCGHLKTGHIEVA